MCAPTGLVQAPAGAATRNQLQTARQKVLPQKGGDVGDGGSPTTGRRSHTPDALVRVTRTAVTSTLAESER